MASTPYKHQVAAGSRLGLLVILCFFSLICDVSLLFASKGAGQMSQITPQQSEPAAVNNKEQNTRVKQLVLLGQKRAQHGRAKDPLLRENTDAFSSLLEKRQNAVSTPNVARKDESEGLLHSFGLEDEANELKRKAFSLLVQLGFVESGKTNELRQRITHETRQAVMQPVAHVEPQKDDEKTAPASVAQKDAGADNIAAKPLNDDKAQVSSKVDKDVLQEVASKSATPVTDATNKSEPIKVKDEEQVATAKETAPSPVTEDKPRTKLLSDATHLLRVPVNAETRRSVAIDMMAEKKAREILTAEAKESLLPVTGELSAVFESGKDGIAAIGYDRRGGTSYGKYQIASRVGSMSRFIGFLDDRAPEYAERLRNAGPANTRSRWGGMPSEWKKIAAEDPEGFEELQDEFILATNYQPALNGIKDRANLDVASLSPAVQEVLWSTAVQHGPAGASSIFSKAASNATGQDSQEFDKSLIEEVYKARKRNFSGSSRRIRTAVTARLNREQLMALDLLEKDLNKEAVM